MKTRFDRLRDLIILVADDVDHLETMFDVVSMMTEGDSKKNLDMLIYYLLTTHPKY